MWAHKPHNHASDVRGLAVTAILVLSVTLLIPGFVRNASALTPTFSRPNYQVDAGPGDVDYPLGGGPSIAVGIGGELYAVWSDDRSGTDKGIYYAKSTNGGATWFSEMRIDGATGYSNVAPSIAVDISGGSYGGSIYVVWQKGEGATADVLFIKSIDDGLTWMNRYRIDTAPLNVPSTLPKVAVDGAGTIYVTFIDSRNGNQDVFIATSGTGGFGWSNDVPLSSSTESNEHPSLSASGTLAAVAWEENGAADSSLIVAVSDDKGASWRVNTIVSKTSGTGNVSWVSIDADDHGTLHASWTSVDQLGAYAVAYSRSLDNGTTWTFPVRVDDSSPSPSFRCFSSTVVSTATALYVIWSDNRNGDYDILVSWSENGGVTWGDLTPGNDVRVDDTDENVPIIDDSTSQSTPFASASQFGVYAVWADGRDTVAMHTYFASFDSDLLIVTEIRDSPDGMERVEIYNRGQTALDVTGWFIDIDGTSNFISPLGSIPSLQYRTIGDEASSNLQVDITLNDEGGAVRIFDQAGNLREIVEYGQKGSAPDPLSLESTGRVYHSGEYTRYWTRSATPSFGMQNADLTPDTDSDLVLNEVLYSATDPNRRFIELMYKGNGSLDLAGYVMAGDVSFTIPAATLDSLRNYFLVFSAQAPSLFSSMDVTGDNLYLYDSAGRLLDMVGWTSPHAVDESICRVPDGFGFSEGFDDRSSVASGWHFGCVPSPHLVGIGPSGTIFANLSDVIYHEVHVTNYMSTPTLVDLRWNLPPSGWAVALMASDHVTALPDTNSNGWPDVSLDVFGSPGQTVNVSVRVSTPASAPQNDSVTTTVTAEGQPEGRDSVDLITGFYPYLSLNRSASPTTVYVRGTGYGEESMITLDLRGRGMKIPGSGPDAVDVVFVVDDTGSMGIWINAVKTDVDYIANSLYANITDVRFGLVSYKDVPFIDIDQDLTPDTVQFKTALSALSATGGGDFPEDPDVALQTASNLSWRPGSIPKVMILIGDAPAHDNTHLAMVARWAHNSLAIHTNAIGCGNSVEMVNAFTATALEGHGYFIQLGNPSAMADAIISGIMAVIPTVDYAAQDRNLTDGNPMIRDVLPPYIAYTPGSFIDPVTKTPKQPAYVSTDVSGNTILEWNVSVLKINRTWSVQFNITSSLTGLVLTDVSGASRASFTNWSGANVTLYFPEVWINVLPTPPLSDLTLSSTDIAPYPPSPYLELHPMSLNATIHNVGQNMSGSTFVRFYDGVPPAPVINSDQPLAPLAVFETGIVSVPWTPTIVGTHVICVEADPGDLVREVNETNNIACLTVYIDPTKPDYVPYLPQPPGDSIVGLSQAVNLSAMVMNSGNRSAPSNSTFAFRNQTGLPFTYFTVPALMDGGTSMRFTVRWISPAVPGTYLVSATVDYNNTLTEWNETNNVFTWTVRVVGGPRTFLVIGDPNVSLPKTFIKSATPLFLTVEDRSGTGIKRTAYSVDYGPWKNLTPGGSFYLSGEGEHNVRWYSQDFAGNMENESAAMLVVDDTAPTSSLSVGVPKYLGRSTFVTSLTPITLAASDLGDVPVGIKSTHFRIRDGTWGSWATYSVPFKLGGRDGPREIEYYTDDLLGNSETPVSVSMVVDNSPPVMDLEPAGTRFAIGILFSIAAGDGSGSGVDMVWYSLDSGSFANYTGSFSLGLGQHTIVYKSVDQLGNPIESSRVVDVVEMGAHTLSVSYNYKPMVAFVFSLVILLLAAFSSRRRPLKYGKNLRRRFALSLAVLPLPFLIAEAATGLLSVSFEFLRIPPLLGWGTTVDTLILILGVLFLALRLVTKKKGKKSDRAESSMNSGADAELPPPPEE